MGQPNWVPLGQPAFTPGFEFYNFCVGQNTDGRLEVFLLGNNGILGHSWQLAPGKDWSEWASMGEPPNNTSPAFPRVKHNADGRLEVFVLGCSDYRPWHIWQLAPGKKDWSNWSSLGQPAGVNVGSPVLVRNVDGRLEVFDVGSDGALWDTWQLSPNGTWSEWVSLGSTPLVPGGPTEPVVGTNKDGRLEIFVTDASAVLWHSWQLSPKGAWSEWASLNKPPDLQPNPDTGVIPTPVVVENSDGRLEVFLPGKTTCWHIWQISPGGSWSS